MTGEAKERQGEYGMRQARKRERGITYTKRAGILLAAALMLGSLTACGGSDGQSTKVVLTTGFEKGEVFRIESVSCKLPEIMVYLTNIQDRYESVYGPEIWSANAEGVTLEDNVKDIALAQIAQIKTMSLMARQYEVDLTKEEQTKVKEAAKTYFDSLSAVEKEKLDVTQKTIEELYQEFALAQKVYEHTIKDINPEISDDEARTITVQHILIKTYAMDGTGKKIEYSTSAKHKAYLEASEILAMAREGEDFDELIRRYSEDSQATYSFGKGEMDPAFEKAAFDLGKDEISDVVETQYGYHIIKCLNIFDKEETDANKVKIVEQRRKEAFGQEYDAFVAGLTRNLNEELWNNVAFIHDENVTTQSFFDVYNQYFGE